MVEMYLDLSIFALLTAATWFAGVGHCGGTDVDLLDVLCYT